MLPLLLARAALAQEAATPEDPLPIAGDAWPARVTAYALPPQRLRYLTDEAPARRCAVQLRLGPTGDMEVSPGACPAPMVEDALAATRAWRLTPIAPDPTGPSRFTVTYVMNYSATLGVTTLHAEIDPGRDDRWARGAAGVKLVHAAEPDRPLRGKLTGRLRAAGATPGTCRLGVEVNVAGGAQITDASACPAPLLPDATERVGRARFNPRTVDGAAMPDQIVVEIPYEG